MPALMEIDLLMKQTQRKWWGREERASGRASIVKSSGEALSRRPVELLLACYIHVMGLLILGVFSRGIVLRPRSLDESNLSFAPHHRGLSLSRLRFLLSRRGEP